MNLSRILLAAVLTNAALAQPAPSVPEQPDAHRTKAQLVSLLGRYPSNLEIVLANDPSLLTNQTYLSTYPALAGFLSEHPDVARNPLFYFSDFLRGASFNSARQLREAIDAFVEVYNEKAIPFEWTKAVVHPTGPRVNYSYLCK